MPDQAAWVKCHRFLLVFEAYLIYLKFMGVPYHLRVDISRYWGR